MTLLSHSLFAPAAAINVFHNDIIIKEIQQLSHQFDTFDSCRSFLTYFTCIFSYPPCNDTTGKLLQICPDACFEINSNIDKCGLANLDGFPAITKFLNTFDCFDPQTYIKLPAQYIEFDSNSCAGFCKYSIYIMTLVHNMFSNPPTYIDMCMHKVYHNIIKF